MSNNEVLTKEEVVVSSNAQPDVVQTTTTKVAQPRVGDNPQKVFQAKKSIFQINNIISYIAGLIVILLLARFVLKVISSDTSTFTNFIYNITDIFVAPFVGIVAPTVSGNAIFEWASMIAMIVIFTISLLIIYFINLIRPVSPEEVRASE